MNQSGQRVVLLGGTGFLGVALAQELRARNVETVTVARGSSRRTAGGSVRGRADGSAGTGADATAGTGRGDTSAGARRAGQRGAARRGPDIRADVTRPGALDGIIRRGDTVVYLVARSPVQRPPGGRRTYRRMHLEGVRHALAAAEEAGAAHVAYVSALGVTRGAGAAYAETKALAEEWVVRSRIPSTIIAPSILFGEGSEIISLLRRLSALPVVPVPRISAPFRPIHVGDAARLAAEAVTASAPPRLPLTGPERLSFFEIVSRFLQAAGTTVVPLPPIIGEALVRAVSVVRIPGLPAELRAMLAIDNAGEAPAHADDLTRYSNWVIEAAGP
mgnify:CR=1 FL=1